MLHWPENPAIGFISTTHDTEGKPRSFDQDALRDDEAISVALIILVEHDMAGIQALA